jgi:hypothetical protein
MINGIKITTDGHIEKFETDKELHHYIPFWFGFVRKSREILGAVDDCGLLKRLPYNEIGTKFLEYPNPIVGDVYLLKEGMTEEGPDIIAFDNDELNHLYDILRCLI